LGIGFRFAESLSDSAPAFLPARRRGLGRNAGGLLGWGLGELGTEKSTTNKNANQNPNGSNTPNEPFGFFGEPFRF